MPMLPLIYAFQHANIKTAVFSLPHSPSLVFTSFLWFMPHNHLTVEAKMNVTLNMGKHLYFKNKSLKRQSPTLRSCKCIAGMCTPSRQGKKMEGEGGEKLCNFLECKFVKIHSCCLVCFLFPPAIYPFQSLLSLLSLLSVPFLSLFFMHFSFIITF